MKRESSSSPELSRHPQRVCCDDVTAQNSVLCVAIVCFIDKQRNN